MNMSQYNDATSYKTITNSYEDQLKEISYVQHRKEEIKGKHDSDDQMS